MFGRTVKFIISGGFWFCCLVFDLWKQMSGAKVPATSVTIYYHGVKEHERSRFVKQMEILKKLAKPLSAEAKNTVTNGVRYVSVTFDDGFQSLVANALPELVKRAIPITVFVPLGFISRRPSWIESKSHGDNSEVVMTKEQIKGLPRGLVTIGSHGVSHLHLETLPEEDLRRELRESKEQLEKLTDYPVTLLSFPHGGYNERVLEAARRAGYERVFSVLPQLAGPSDYVVGRIAVTPSDWPLEFRLKILGAYRWLPLAFQLKRKLRASFTRDACSEIPKRKGIQGER